MSFRVSTLQLQTAGIGTLQRQQVQLAELREQLATGQRVRTAADDPTDYASAIGIEDSLNAVRQFQSNAERVGTRMALAESVLCDVTDTLGRVRELALSAGNATQDSRSRAVIGQEMRQLKEQLVALANTRDADGR